MKPNSIQVDAGNTKILIDEDEKRVVEFNPLDVLFGEKFYALMADFDEKNIVFQAALVELKKNKDKDKFGLPKSLSDSFSLTREMCEFTWKEIDGLFGEGTAKTVFEGRHNLYKIHQFLEGMVPFIEAARKKQMAKYVKAKPKQKSKVKT